MLLPGILIVPVAGRRGSGKMGAVVLLVALLMIGALLSCAGVSSGGGGGTSPPPINPATYKVTVTGSSPGTPANAGHTVVVTLA
jgi:hypothetical protein